MDSPVRIQLKKNDYLRHKFFRTLNRRKKRLLLQLIEAPEKELRRRLRLKRYEGGKNPMDYEYRGTVYDDELKNQGITHVAELPEVVVKGRDYTKPYESAFEYDPNFAKELPYFLPVVGDALDAADVAKNVYNGNYLSAGIGAGMLALPNFIEKPIKKLYAPWKVSRAMNRSLDNNPIIRTYESNPMYRDIGTLLDYQDYVLSMFPNSKIKNVVFHTTTSKPFETFDPAKVKRGFGFYFSPSEHKLPFNRNVYARINMERPLVINTTNRGLSVDGLAGDIDGTKAALKENNYDGIVGVTNMRNPGEPEIVALNPRQIHILGSNHDLAEFKRASSSLSPQITAENAASITPEQWTAAQDAAIARGDMAEAQRLRDLHFKVSAPKTEVVDINGNPQLVVHKTPHTFTVFDNSRSIGNLNWFATPNAYGENGVFATGAGKNPRTMKLYVNMRNAHRPTIEEGMEAAFINDGEDGILGIVDKDMTNFHKSASDAGKGFIMSGGVDNPNALKSADAVTYDNKGVRIPLGERDNFNLNDIRYGLLPFGMGLAAYGTINSNSGTTVYSKGKDSGIHIKPENRGKFNALKKRTGKTTEELTHSKNPLTRKRAIFAQNARKWNHKK